MLIMIAIQVPFKEQDLSSCDLHFFRYNNPTEAAKLREIKLSKEQNNMETGKQDKTNYCHVVFYFLFLIYLQTTSL